MKLHPEDPRLTAHVLGELGPEEAAAVEKAVAGDPVLQTEIAELEATRKFLTGHFAIPGDTLLPSQRDNIRRLARKSASTGSIRSFASIRETLQPWLIPASAAAVLAIATFILIRMPAAQKTSRPNEASAERQPSPNTVSPEDANPGKNPPPPVVAKPEAPAMVQRGSVKAADFPTLELPVQSGKSSLEWISKSIRIDGRLPSHQTVRLEELLNNFQLRLNGTTAIARGDANNWHPDTRQTGMSAHVATLSTEMIACPWKPSSTLLLISLRGGAQEGNSGDVKISYHANPQNVFRYRLLGFAPAGNNPPSTLPSRLATNAVATLAIEIEPSRPGAELGSLIWSAGNKEAPSISLIHKSDTEPSDDARFAALVCTYAQWLSGEQAGAIDADIVSALAREIASSTLPADRADFLALIDRSLHL
ncbi:MAG: hypothetical protein V4584_06345 [Verrucomicrobiota bacterium]